VSVRKLQRENGNVPVPAKPSADVLVERHRDLVAHVARDFERRLPPSVTFGDLLSAGNLGLVEAARRFKAGTGASFPTFARHRIHGAIMDSLRRLDPLSRRLRSFQKAVSQASDALTAKLGRQPADTEIAARIGMPFHRFERLSRELRGAGGLSSLAAPTPALSSDMLPAKCVSPELHCERAELREALDAALDALPVRCRIVIRCYHFEGLTMAGIGHRLGISEGRVSQIHAGAIRRLRESRWLRMHA